MDTPEPPRQAFLKLLKKHRPEDIVETDHAAFSRQRRGIKKMRIVADLFDPGSLRFVKEEPFTEVHLRTQGSQNYRKFLCFYSKNREIAHKYVICLNEKIYIITVLPISKRWQRHVNKFRSIPF